MKKFLLAAFMLTILSAASAQDKHFTQFYASPLTLNPALTGAFDGRYRVYGIYRDQWRGVLDAPYVTFAGAADVRWDMVLDSRYKDAFAVGLLFYNDKVGGLDFTTNQMTLSAAFHKGLDFDKKQFLSIGIQAGLAQRSISYEDLTFDDQFNDLNAFNMATREDLPENNFAFSDFAAGLNYNYSPKNGAKFFAGFALHHFLQPRISFYPEDNANLIIEEDKLYMQISGQFSAQIPLNDRLSLVPRALIAKQGPHLEVNTGTNLRIGLNNYNGNALQLGSWVRPVSNEDNSMGLDALIFLVGFELGNVSLGFSYDLNLNSVSNVGRAQNAFEFSATYIGSFEDESILCPRF
ncbi:MAG: PorP/SprF family type IX secretion system membrane protein [Bacteroidota bacterium]